MYLVPETEAAAAVDISDELIKEVVQAEEGRHPWAALENDVAQRRACSWFGPVPAVVSPPCGTTHLRNFVAEVNSTK